MKKIIARAYNFSQAAFAVETLTKNGYKLDTSNEGYPQKDAIGFKLTFVPDDTVQEVIPVEYSTQEVEYIPPAPVTERLELKEAIKKGPGRPKAQ